MAVEDLPEDVADRKVLVQDVKEDLAQFGGHEGVERGVEPRDFASPPPSCLFLLDSWMIGELFCVALFLEFRTAH